MAITLTDSSPLPLDAEESRDCCSVDEYVILRSRIVRHGR
jgi:hypothetical protein